MYRKMLKKVLIMVLVLASLLGVAAPAHAANITVVGLFKNKAIVLVDGNRHILAVGETSPEGARLISADSETAVLEADGHRNAYRLGSSQGARFTERHRPTVTITPNRQGMFAVNGSINGQAVDFLVDTGATTVAMNQQQAQRLGLLYQEGRPTRVSTAAGPAVAFQVRLDRVRVGEIELAGVDAVVIEGDSPEQALLGMSFLGRLELHNEGRRLRLQTKY